MEASAAMTNATTAPSVIPREGHELSQD